MAMFCWPRFSIFSEVDHGDLVGQPEDELDVVLDEEHCDACLAQRAHAFLELLDLGLREAGRGLVHQHHFRLERDHAGELEQPPLARRQVAGRGRDAVAETDGVEQARGAVERPPLVAPRPRQPQQVADRVGLPVLVECDHDVLAAECVLEDRRRLERPSQPALRAPMCLVFVTSRPVSMTVP